jgi:aryl-alcohol dehydrogenase-like predicted oxidoreductase
LAREIIDVCVDAGINLFDTADLYSLGQSEEILGKAVAHLKRDSILLSTKVSERVGPGPNDLGASRHHILRSVDGSLKRLGTDYIDIYHLHEYDALPAVEETVRALDDVVRAGKVRYIACSNFMAWQIMKALSISERYGWARYVSHQVYSGRTRL